MFLVTVSNAALMSVHYTPSPILGRCKDYALLNGKYPLRLYLDQLTWVVKDIRRIDTDYKASMISWSLSHGRCDMYAQLDAQEVDIQVYSSSFDSCNIADLIFCLREIDFVYSISDEALPCSLLAQACPRGRRSSQRTEYISFSLPLLSEKNWIKILSLQ